MNQGRYRVRGLDGDGIRGSALGNLFDAAIDTGMRRIVTAVGATSPTAPPGCTAPPGPPARGWRSRHTGWRSCGCGTRRTRARGPAVAPRLVPGRGPAARGVGRRRRGPDRPPLEHRPRDAALEWPFEVPYAHLHSIAGWQPPLIRPYPGGPRHVQVHVMDGSWARLETDEAGAAALLPGG